MNQAMMTQAKITSMECRHHVNWHGQQDYCINRQKTTIQIYKIKFQFPYRPCILSETSPIHTPFQKFRKWLIWECQCSVGHHNKGQQTQWMQKQPKCFLKCTEDPVWTWKSALQVNCKLYVTLLNTDFTIIPANLKTVNKCKHVF